PTVCSKSTPNSAVAWRCRSDSAPDSCSARRWSCCPDRAHILPRLFSGSQPFRERGNIMALTTDEVLAGLAELVTDETGIDASEVAMEKSFTDDLDIDSISMMTIVVNAEEKFG